MGSCLVDKVHLHIVLAQCYASKIDVLRKALNHLHRFGTRIRGHSELSSNFSSVGSFNRKPKISGGLLACRRCELGNHHHKITKATPHVMRAVILAVGAPAR
jgi:hypothetical protein